MKDIMDMKRNISPLGKDISSFAPRNDNDLELEQSIIQLKKNNENLERENAELKKKLELKKTEMEEEIN